MCFGALSTPSLISSMPAKVLHVFGKIVLKNWATAMPTNCTPDRLLKIKISSTKYVPRFYNIFCKQVNAIYFRQWILQWPSCLTLFLPCICKTTVSIYGTDEYDSVLKCTLYSSCHICMW